MTNREWLYSLSPLRLKEWFDANRQDGWMHCSECRGRFPWPDLPKYRGMLDYCPLCGAYIRTERFGE